MGDPGSTPGLGRSLGEEMAIHSSTLAWKIPWTEEPGGLQHGVAKSWTRLSDFTFTFMVSCGHFSSKILLSAFPRFILLHTPLTFFGFCLTFVYNLSSSHSRFLPHGQQPHFFPLKHFLLWQIPPFSKVRILLETLVLFLDMNHHPNFP